MPGMLDLPPEMRLMIYDYLLTEYRFLLGRRHTKFTSQLGDVPRLALFLVNRQIYEEASEAFYGDRVIDLRIHSAISPGSEPYFELMGRTVKFSGVAKAIWLSPVLRRIRQLRIRLHLNGCTSICETQDVMHAVTSRIGTKHALKSLLISISITPPRPGSNGIRPQHLSPAHVAHFLTAPVSSLCANKRKYTKFELTITGEEGQPLELVDEIMAAAHDRELRDRFKPMLQYARILRLVIEVAAALESANWHNKMDDLLRGISTARLHGDSVMLQTFHKALMVQLMTSVVKSSGRADRNGEAKNNREELQKSLGFLTDALVHVIDTAPETVDLTGDAEDGTAEQPIELDDD